MKKYLKYFTWFCIALALVVTVLATKPASTPFIYGDKSISSLIKINIGGYPQTVVIRAKDISKPVLLYIHGGPGGGELPLSSIYSRGLEDEFVMVFWEQRGATSSCRPKAPLESLTLDQIVKDAIELSEYLKARFKQKIYLVGGSWGSLVGILAVQRRPDLFHSYIGLGQIVSTELGYIESQDFVRRNAVNENNKEVLEKLNSLKGDAAVKKSELFPDIIRYGGFIHNWQEVLKVSIPALLFSPEYSLTDRLSHFSCLKRSQESLNNELSGINFIRDVNRLDVPVYILSGRHDFNTPSSLVDKWLSKLTAPYKEEIWFEKSGHMVMLEEPEKFIKTVLYIKNQE